MICEGTIVGSIVRYSHSHGDTTPWSWSITMSAPVSKLTDKHGKAASRDEAMAAFRRAWDIYRPEIGDDWWRRHLDHSAWLDEQQRRWDARRAETEPGGYG